MSPPASETPSLREVRLGINTLRGLSERAGSVRDRAQWKIVQIATMAGVTHAHISGIENGRHRASEYLLKRLAGIYDVPYELMRAAQEETLRRVGSGEPQVKR